jgi:hypothetical protein
MAKQRAGGFPIHPSAVRYIKLGGGGSWEKECIEKGIIRIGFGSGGEKRNTLYRAARWSDLSEAYIAEGKTRGTATRFTHELRLFAEDPGSTLWITFVGEQLCWGQLEPGPAQRHPDAEGVFRVVAGGWRQTDRAGERLTKDRLSGALNKLAAYRGTSCKVDVADYVVRRINGDKTPEVERALAARATMRAAVEDLMKLLHWRDFETLVDLVFTTTGWRRRGRVGGTQKTLDLDLYLPTTEEKAFVQVKAKTNSAEAAEYVAKLDEMGSYDRMFYVYHSGKVTIDDDERVTVIGPARLAEMVVDAGLAGWVIEKVS